MFEEILPDLFKVQVPLPGNPLKYVNSYLIKSNDRSLIIDTGMNREECASVLEKALKHINLDLSKTDFFITHLHVDHIGLVERLRSPSSRVFFNQIEAEMVADNFFKNARWTQATNIFIENGFPEAELVKSTGMHPGRRFGMDKQIPFVIIKENEVIKVGDYNLRCIKTPGHSPGHTCLFEDKKKILFSGDCILFDITPNITVWPNLNNSLKQYLQSLDKLYALDVNHVLPGHRSLNPNHRKRIEELKEHHNNRLLEVIEALKNGNKNAFQIAPYITWDSGLPEWKIFPAQQKWFAFGETMAHIRFLEAEGKIVSNNDKGTYYFSLV